MPQNSKPGESLPADAEALPGSLSLSWRWSQNLPTRSLKLPAINQARLPTKYPFPLAVAKGPLLLTALLLSSCAASPPIKPQASPTSQRSVSLYQTKPFFVQEGIASWYGGRWIGRMTANGERYRHGDMTAAHKTLPFNTRVRVTDLKTGKQVIVRINNRGPYTRGRIIDLSVRAAQELGTYSRGLAKVRIEAFREIPVLTQPNLRVQSLESPEKKPTPAKKSERRKEGAESSARRPGGVGGL